MTRRSKIWWWAAGLYGFINVAGLAYAAAEREEMHAMLHLFLLILGFAGYVGWWLARRGAPQDLPQDLSQSQLPEARIAYLQQSIDAMALELERVGEAQRFNEKLRGERAGNAPANAEIPPSKKEQ
jgi:hypothetical protein